MLVTNRFKDKEIKCSALFLSKYLFAVSFEYLSMFYKPVAVAVCLAIKIITKDMDPKYFVLAPLQPMLTNQLLN